MAFQFINRRGSVVLPTTRVAVNTDNVVFSFQNHAFLNAWYRGTLFINIVLAIPTSADSTLPIVFETNGVTLAVKKVGGDDLTVGDIGGVGIYEFWFDKSSNLLQLIP